MDGVYLESSREANEVGTNTESCTRASGNTHAGDIGIQDAERGSSRECEKTDFLHIQRSLRDGIGGDSYHKTLHQVLNNALYQFRSVKH